MKKILISENNVNKEITVIYGKNNYPVRRLCAQIGDQTKTIYDMLWDNDQNWPFNTDVKNPWDDTEYGVTKKKTIMKQAVSNSTYNFFYCLERVNSVNTYKLYENEIGTDVYTEIRSGPLGHESVMRIVFDTLYIATTPGEYVVRYDGSGNWTTIGTSTPQGRYIFEITHLNGNLIRNVESNISYWNGSTWKSFTVSGMNNVKHHDGYLYGIGNYPNLYIYRHDGTTRTTVSGLLSSARKLIQSGDRLFALDDERRLYEISDDTAEQIGTESGFSETSGIVLNDVFIYAIKEVGFQSYLVYRWDGATWDSVPSFSLKEYRSSLISYWTKLALLNNSIVLHNIGVYGVLFYCESRDMFMPLGFPGQFYNDNIYPYDDTPIYTEGTSFMYSSGEKIMYFDNMGGNQIWNKSLPFEELL